MFAVFSFSSRAALAAGAFFLASPLVAQPNLLKIEDFGAQNPLRIEQADERGNSLVVDLYGTPESDASSLPGRPAAFEDITQGTLSQIGTDNGITMDLTGTGNLFAIRQTGRDNRVQGAITGAENMAVIQQTGTHNVAAFSQTGIGNTVEISQSTW